SIDRFPSVAILVKQRPRLRTAAAAIRRIVEPINFNRGNFARFVEIVLHPLGAAAMIPPGEPRNAVVVRILRFQPVNHRFHAVPFKAVRRGYRRRFGLGPWARLRANADHRERRDAQSRRPHRNQRDSLGRLIALHGTVLKFSDQTEAVQFPGRNFFGFGAQRNRRSLSREWICSIPRWNEPTLNPSQGGELRGRARGSAPLSGGGGGGFNDLERTGRITFVQDKPAVPSRAWVHFPFRPGVGAAVTRPVLANFQ